MEVDSNVRVVSVMEGIRLISTRFSLRRNGRAGCKSMMGWSG